MPTDHAPLRPDRKHGRDTWRFDAPIVAGSIFASHGGGVPSPATVVSRVPEIHTNVGQFWESVFWAARHSPQGEVNPADEFLPDDRLIAVAMPEVRTNVGQFWESVFLAARHLPEGEVNPVEVEELRSDDRLIAVVTRSIQGGANEARTRELVGRKMGQVWALKDGWRGPGSLAPSKVARDFYLSVVQVLPGRLLGPAQPTPTADGGIHMEWRRGDYDYEAEITCDGELILTVLGPDDDDETVIQSPTTADLVEFVCHGA